MMSRCLNHYLNIGINIIVKQAFNVLQNLLKRWWKMKIAIIIPVYNAENTIRRAIKSIDTTHEVEIICVNDGSTDHSRHELTQLQKKLKIS